MREEITAAQHKLPVVFIVPVNGDYCILQSLAKLEDAPGVPGQDIPNLDLDKYSISNSASYCPDPKLITGPKNLPYSEHMWNFCHLEDKK